MGIIRPTLIAQFSATRDFANLASTTNLALRANLAIIGGAIAAMAAVADPLASLLTNGKYPEAGTLLLGFLILMLLESMKLALELMAKVAEQSKLLFGANWMLVVGLAVAIPLTYEFGALGLVLARGIGVTGTNIIVARGLWRRGFPFRPERGWMLLIGAYVVTSSAAGSVAYQSTESLLVGIALSLSIYLLLFWIKPPLNRLELNFFLRLRRDRAAAGA
jgi:hypothetical protein